MLETIADLVAELNVPSKLQEDADLYTLDNLRLLHGKLVSLKRVAKLTEPEEWDAMIQALLASKHYGVDDLEARLRPGKQPPTRRRAARRRAARPRRPTTPACGKGGAAAARTITELVDAGAQLGVVRRRVGVGDPRPADAVGARLRLLLRECGGARLPSDGLLLAAASPSAKSSRSRRRWRASPARSPPSSCSSCCMPTGACGPRRRRRRRQRRR